MENIKTAKTKIVRAITFNTSEFQYNEDLNEESREGNFDKMTAKEILNFVSKHNKSINLYDRVEFFTISKEIHEETLDESGEACYEYTETISSKEYKTPVFKNQRYSFAKF